MEVVVVEVTTVQLHQEIVSVMAGSDTIVVIVLPMQMNFEFKCSASMNKVKHVPSL